MWNSILISLRILSLLSGLLLLYAAFFLYEDEQGNIQNRLEDSWIKLSDLSRSALSHHTAFIRMVARSTAHILDRIFGQKLFSARFIGVSICLSFISIFSTALWYPYGFAYHYVPLLLLIATYLALAIISSFISNQWLIKFWLAFVIALTPFTIITLHIFPLTPEGSYDTTHIQFDLELATFLLPAYLTAIAIAVICDMLFVALTRWILQWVSELNSSFKIIATLFLNSCLVVSFLIVPLYYQDAFARYAIGQYPQAEVGFWSGWFGPGFGMNLPELYDLAFFSNFYTSLIATLFIVLIIIMLLHKLLWPIIERPVYALQEIGVARRKKVLAALGIVLIAIWLGRTSEFLKIFEKLAP